MKKKGWINPAEFDFDELMKIITYMTRPATLGSLNAGLYLWMMDRGNRIDARNFMLASVTFFILTIVIGFYGSSFAVVNPIKLKESYDKRKKKIGFPIALLFMLALLFSGLGIVDLIVEYLKLLNA